MSCMCEVKSRRQSPRTTSFGFIVSVLCLSLHGCPGMALVNVAKIGKNRFRGCVPSRFLAAMSSSSSSRPAALTEFEVEQKFALGSSSQDETATMEKRLIELGFVVVHHHDATTPTSSSSTLVDWYWDATTRDHPWALTTQDCWLRHRRQGSKAAWQLKLRRHDDDDETTGATTVYEEMSGTDALAKAVALLSPGTDATFNEDKDDIVSSSQQQQQQQTLLNMFRQEFQQDLPTELRNPTDNKTPLVLPFARIETKRSSWRSSKTTEPHYAAIRVDLDTAIYDDNTDDIYTVGEVEEVVTSAEDIPQARRRVQQFIEQLIGVANTSSGEPSPPVVVGKLEYYLIHNQPEHYQALVESGVLKQ
jgi:hypothetical protein